MVDEHLVLSAKKGDEEAFFKLIDANKVRLYRIAYSFLKNETEALEAIQEVTYRAYTKLHQIKEPAYFQTWLVRIMVNYCISERKRQKRFVPEVESVEAASYEDSDIRVGIEVAVDRLEAKYKKIIILKYFQDLTISEIARVLGYPDGTIKTWLNKALKVLRKDLGKAGE